MSMPSINLATPADLPALLRMVEGLADFHGDAPTATLETLQRDFCGPVKWLHTLIARHADDCVGYAALLPLARLQFGQRGMELHLLYVEHAARGRGIGQALVAAAADYARSLGCSYFTVSASDENAAAHRFYLRNGFADKPVAGRRFSMVLTAEVSTTVPSWPATPSHPCG